jgi:hypothetical protein
MLRDKECQVPNFRRGAAAIDEAATRKGGNGFRPFVPTIQWQDDRESKHVLFLTPVDEIPTVEYHEWIPVGTGQKANGETYTKYEQFISRKDPAIGESEDELQDRLGVAPKSRSIAVAVELEAITENDGRRERVTGFTVATDTYTRKDENGGEQEVTQPLIGLVIQSAQNFFGWLSSYDASQGPIEETPMSVTRRGKDANTTYDFIALEGRPVDLGPLMDHIDGISYLRDDIEDILSNVDSSESDEEAAAFIAGVLLNKRLDELADKERYDELVAPIEKIESKFGNKKAAPKNGGTTRRERPARPSRREAVESAPAEPAEAPAAEEAAPATGTARFNRLRAKVEAKQS